MFEGRYEKIDNRIEKDKENRKKYAKMLADSLSYEVAVIADVNVKCLSKKEFIAYYELNRVKADGEIGSHYTTRFSVHKNTERAQKQLLEDFGKIFSDFNPKAGHPTDKVGCSVIVETDRSGKIIDISEPKKFFAKHSFAERE